MYLLFKILFYCFIDLSNKNEFIKFVKMQIFINLSQFHPGTGRANTPAKKNITTLNDRIPALFFYYKGVGKVNKSLLDYLNISFFDYYEG
jgi:hypothetical protein